MAPSDAVLKSPGSPVRPGRESQRPVLCIAGRSFLDEAAAALLAQILGKHGIEAKVEPTRVLGSGQISRLSTDDTRMVCLSYLDAELSTAGARYVVRRLRRRLGDIKILAGFWQTDPGQASELCAATKADFCAPRVRDALDFCLEGAKGEAKQDEELTLAVKTSPERDDLIVVRT